MVALTVLGCEIFVETRLVVVVCCLFTLLYSRVMASKPLP